MPDQYPFYDRDKFPELKYIESQWKVIRDEAMEYKDDFYPIEDPRNYKGWSAMPLKPEADDINFQGMFNEELVARRDMWKDKFPETRSICDSIENEGYVFSCLAPLGHIKPHIHEEKHVSTLMGLDLGDNCIFKVGNSTKEIKAGEFLVFDYQIPHTAWNLSNKDRVALVVVLKNKYKD